MVSQWIPLHRYQLLRSPDDTDGTTPRRASCKDWLALRRVRTALMLGAITLVVFSLSRIADLPADLGAALTQYQNGSLPEASSVVNWSDFAYVQYVTNENYLCNSLMILEALHRVGAKADRIMMFPEDWQVPEDDGANSSTEGRLLAQARNLYQTKLVPVKVQTLPKGDPTWQDSYTKLLAFNQTQYKRLISLDSDAIVRDHMDELFLIPPSPVAMPRAYWLDQPFLSSQLILLEPSEFEWRRIQEFMTHNDSGFDMDILNTIYKNSCIVLPHRKYDILSAEFRARDHTKYLGSNEDWNGTKALEESKFIHFSDWPVPKPWLEASDEVKSKYQPQCKASGNGHEDCTDRDIWLGLYREFSTHRQRVCNRSYDRRRRLSRSALPPKYEPILV